MKAGPSQLNPVLGGPTAGSGMSDTSWLEIEAWLATHAPDMLQRLPAGADPKALRDLEDRLALQLPQSLLQSLLRHDGSGEQALHEYGCFCSTAQVLALWEQETDLWGDGDNDERARPRGPIKRKWWSPRWIPVLHTWDGNCVALDLDPPSPERRGQVISWYHDSGPGDAIAPSFAVLLREFAESLAQGKYRPGSKGNWYLEYLP